MDTHTLKITEIIDTLEEIEDDRYSREYVVEEPDNYDYIFEPDYPTTHGTEIAELEATTETMPKASLSSEEKYKNGVKILKRKARMVSENDGVLEYEYNSNADVRGRMDDDEEFFENYFHDFDYKHYHLNAVIRSISFSKCPGTPGFGFKLDRHMENGEDLFYVKEISSETPAELCLRLGDILIELDERNPCETFKGIEECEEYLNKRNSVHMMVIHESKYFRLKSNKDEDLIKNHCINCEDMVVVSWDREFEANLIH